MFIVHSYCDKRDEETGIGALAFTCMSLRLYFFTTTDIPLQSRYTTEHKEPALAVRPLHNDIRI